MGPAEDNTACHYKGSIVRCRVPAGQMRRNSTRALRRKSPYYFIDFTCAIN